MATPETSSRPTKSCGHNTNPPPPRPHYHRVRKLVHLTCFLIFVLLPFFNVMRFDIPRQRFYFAGYELLISEFGIIFFALMFLMFVIVVSSVVYGRIYCGYMCPQMIFSEASLETESWIKRKVTKYLIKWPAARRNLLARGLFYAAVGLASVFLSFIFISYFVTPSDLIRRLASLDMHTAGGISGAVVTLITFLDFTLLRQRFCTTVCPYGYLQGMLGDGNTLLVTYRDENQECIECKKCVRDCLMGIDIRKSPYQIECVHCGECIDSCADILGKLGKPGLIHYTWGETGNVVENETAWYRKLGIRDSKRVVVLLVTLFYLSGLYVALSMRRTILVQLQPVRTSMFRLGSDGTVYNTFRVKLSNRGSSDASVAFWLEGLPSGALTLQPSPVPLKAGETIDRQFEVAVRPFAGANEVNRFRILASTGEKDPEVFEETFLMPQEKKSQ
ncbi:4Fe-4S dicluster domain-containing protein [Paludibaculum fermentans]|uniref:4Fe-4S dicluster domain-containing protein n=1 Tax=Paludibaculum fermentans TaxID=1473598 RepID=UPI003EB99A43